MGQEVMAFVVLVDRLVDAEELGMPEPEVQPANTKKIAAVVPKEFIIFLGFFIFLSRIVS
jgi:hypothetical protein